MPAFVVLVFTYFDISISDTYLELTPSPYGKHCSFNCIYITLRNFLWKVTNQNYLYYVDIFKI